MPTALAQAALPSARNSMPSPPEAFFQASITNTSLTPVTATVSTPLLLMAPRFFTKLGRWFLWQVGVNAPGTANSTTFLPLKSSSVVIGFGPSAVITVNVPLGTLSPTLIAMTCFLSPRYGDRIWAPKVVSRTRSSQDGSAGTFANFGSKGTLQSCA